MLSSITESDSTTGKTAEFSYGWDTTGSYGNRIAQVMLKIGDTGQPLTFTPVSSATYEYHGSDTTQGSPGDLRRVIRHRYIDGNWLAVGESYYTYYKLDEPNGFKSALKYALEPEAMARLRAAQPPIDPLTATPQQLATYADYYFAYDSERRVTVERLRGGLDTHTFEYLPRVYSSSSSGTSSSSTSSGAPSNAFGLAFNAWDMKTIETLPDDNYNIVYSNAAGLVMLRVFTTSLQTGAPQWRWGTRFDDSGRVVLKAQPSAVASVNENSDLLFSLHQTTGLVHHFESETVPAQPDGVTQISRVKVSQGEAGVNGEKTPLRERGFKHQLVGTLFRRVLVRDTIFQAAAGGDPATTKFAYLFFQNTLGILQRVTEWPNVPGSQHGTDQPESRVEWFDVNGRLVWLKDERGSLTRHTYDATTGALSETILDVNSTLVSVPAGWSTPNGLHLITNYESDIWGRITQELGPSEQQGGPAHTLDLNGTATIVRRAKWTVYLDHLPVPVGDKGTGQLPSDDQAALCLCRGPAIERRDALRD